jgi:hypothetical protein
MSAFELRLMPLLELKPAAYNPRRVLKPTSPAYKKLKASLAEFGLVESLVWNERTGRVVGGHARLPILAELGYTEVPVSVVRLSGIREKALNLALNNSKLQGRFDPWKLEPLLVELADRPELAATGFDGGTLRALRLEPAKQVPAQPKSDRVEITFVADESTFATLAPVLDKLIGDHELVAHIRHNA